MSESVNLPALGESVTEGTVTRWLKKVGDRVEVDEPLLEVSTDKVDTEIPSPVAGVIEAILVAEDETVEVGTTLVTIGDGSGATEAPAAPAPVAEAPAPAPEPVAEAPAPVVEAPAPAPVVEAQAPAPVVEVDVTLVAHYRDQVKAAFQQKTGVKLSFLPFFALAAAEALTAYPIINATIDGDSIVYPAQENISIAVDTERGLLTPVIRDAAKLDLAGFAAQIADLAERTRDNKLKPDELAGGTFTLTNTGSRGALFDTPIVFLPQSAILGTGIVTKKPVVVSDAGGDAIAIRSMVYLALSYDHRIVDGADAARFLVAVKDRLEGGDFAAKLGI